MQKWEYLSARVEYAHWYWRIRYINDRKMPNWKERKVYETLNALGDEGWELVATTSWAYMAETKSYYYVFKRQKAA